MPVYVGGCSIERGNIASSNKTATMYPDLAIQNSQVEAFLCLFFPDHHGKRGFWRQVGAVDVHHQAILLANDLACAAVYLVKKEYGSDFVQLLISLITPPGCGHWTVDSSDTSYKISPAKKG